MHGGGGAGVPVVAADEALTQGPPVKPEDDRLWWVEGVWRTAFFLPAEPDERSSRTWIGG